MNAITSAESFKRLSKHTMFYLLGTPFDPTLDESYTPVPARIKLTGKLKKVITVKCGKMTDDMFIKKIMFLLVINAHDNCEIDLLEKEELCKRIDSGDYIRECDSELLMGNIDLKKFIAGLKQKLRLVANTTPQAKARLFNNYNYMYRNTLHTFYNENPKLNFNWHIDYEHLVNQTSHDALITLQKEHFSNSDSDLYQELLSFAQGMDDSYTHPLSVVITQTIIDLKIKKPIVPAARRFWQLCYDYNLVELFLKFHSKMPGIFTKQRFPFMHFELIPNSIEDITAQDSLNISIRFKLKIFMGNFHTLMEKKIPPMFLMLKLKQLVHKDNVPTSAEFTYFLNEYLENFEPFNVSTHVLDKLTSLPTLICPELLEIDDLLPQIMAIITGIHAVKDDMSILQDSYSEENKHKTQLEFIQEEASKLALNPLDNIKELTELKAKQVMLINSHPSETISLEKAAIKSIQALEQEIASFNDSKLSLDKQEYTDFIESQGNEIIELAEQNKALKETVHRLKEFPTQTLKSQKQQSCLPMNEISELLKAPSVNGVVHAIKSAYDTIEISKKAMTEIAKITEFLRFDMLFSMLGLLASPEFINLYEKQGSQACFTMFTSKELAFQESKTTKKLKLRDFAFDDGVTRDCKAHLRVCSGYQEQNVLRIYFSIEGGKLYIGMIAKHLEVSTS